MSKYTKEELFRMDAVDVYKLVIGGRISRFPSGFWEQPEAIQNAYKCTKYLIEDVLLLSDKELKEQLSIKLFYDNKLRGMLNACFNNSPIKAILESFPEKDFKVWEFSQVPQGYWTKETGIEATRWLIGIKLKLTDEQLKEQLSFKLFKDNGLQHMLSYCFNSSPTSAILESYPEKYFKPWDFKANTPQGYWTIDTGIEATRWLIETKLQLTDEELKEQLNQNLFIDNGLGSMLNFCFNGSPIQSIIKSYPKKNFKIWEFKNVPNGYWNKERGIEATRWLVETKLQLTDEQLKEQLSFKLFKNNNLAGMLNVCFNNSPFMAINSVYPNKFKKSDFKNYR